MNNAIITGASSGIGMEFARYHAARKGNLFLTARNESALTLLKQEIESKYGVTVHTLPLDLSEKEAPQKIYNTCQELGFEVDILINNAGFGDFGLFHEMDPKRSEQMIQLNILALTQLTRLFLPKMVQHKSGKILNVASTAAFQPGPLMAVYFATKAYVLHFSEAIGNELKGTGVTVTALCPGATASGFQQAAAMEGNKLFSGNIPTSAEVAEFGYHAMLKRKSVVVHGWFNSLMARTAGFFPRGLVLNIARKMTSQS